MTGTVPSPLHVSVYLAVPALSQITELMLQQRNNGHARRLGAQNPLAKADGQEPVGFPSGDFRRRQPPLRADDDGHGGHPWGSFQDRAETPPPLFFP